MAEGQVTICLAFAFCVAVLPLRAQILQLPGTTHQIVRRSCPTDTCHQLHAGNTYPPLEQATHGLRNICPRFLPSAQLTASASHG